MCKWRWLSVNTPETSVNQTIETREEPHLLQTFAKNPPGPTHLLSLHTIQGHRFHGPLLAVFLMSFET
jgi:hypothetical protein